MMIKTGDLREDSVGDFFSSKKVTHFEKNGFIAATEDDVKELKAKPLKEKTAFEQLDNID